MTVENGAKITCYQPQQEKLNGNIFKGRVAIAVKEKPSDDPEYVYLSYIRGYRGWYVYGPTEVHAIR